MENSKHSNYKNENIDTKYLNNMQKALFLKVKNSLLELEKDFIELEDRELTPCLPRDTGVPELQYSSFNSAVTF